MLKRGPEIKLPPLKVPAFLRDLYDDLRERHLLPIVALLIVAIVAIPIAFGGSSDEEASDEAAVTETESSAEAGATAEASQLVAKAAPGLRRYQRRLGDLKARDPFKQKFAEGEGEGSGGGSGSSGGGGANATTIPPSTEDGGSVPSYDGGSGDGSGTTTYKRTFYSYAIDVRVTNLNSGDAAGSSASNGELSGSEVVSADSNEAQSSAAKAKATVRRNLPEYTMLPSRDTPALVFVGATKDERKALFVVSSDVEAIFGDAKCVLGSQRCEMIALEVGLPETIVYGRAGRSFRIELLEVGLVESDKVNRASLGKPKQGKKKG
jgi:hypothetical protein